MIETTNVLRNTRLVINIYFHPSNYQRFDTNHQKIFKRLVIIRFKICNLSNMKLYYAFIHHIAKMFPLLTFFAYFCNYLKYSVLIAAINFLNRHFYLSIIANSMHWNSMTYFTFSKPFLFTLN